MARQPSQHYHYQFQVLRPRVYGNSKYSLPAIGQFYPRPRTRLTVNATDTLSISCAVQKPGRRDSQYDLSELQLIAVQQTPTKAIQRPVFKPKPRLPVSRSSNSVSRSRKPTEIFSVAEDEFYYRNLLKGTFTQFQELLQVYIENPCPFPYLARANRLAPAVVCKPCSSKLDNRRNNAVEWNKVIQSFCHSAEGLIRKVPSVKKVMIKKVDNKFPRKVVVVNVEGVLMTQSSWTDLLVRPSLGNSLKKLRSYYQTVLVLREGSPNTTQFLEFLKDEKVEVSGIYEVNGEELVDYSCIFKDFRIDVPHKQAVIVHALQLPVEELDRTGRDLICYKHGRYTKFFVKRIPFSMRENPVCLAIPALHVGDAIVSFQTVVTLLIAKKDSNFPCILAKHKCKIIATSLVTEAFMDKFTDISVENIRSVIENNSQCCASKKNDSLPLHRFVVVQKLSNSVPVPLIRN